jgi:hypothetical protein
MKKPKPPIDHETRDRLAERVMAVCVGDLSRQLAESRMPKQDVPAAVSFIASLSYSMADAMLAARNAK